MRPASRASKQCNNLDSAGSDGTRTSDLVRDRQADILVGNEALPS
jgi:hypothetical protein